jgi:phosphatidylserine/phosphatidylglycerophosphate/cardiolipin synthase-like enzyme
VNRGEALERLAGLGAAEREKLQRLLRSGRLEGRTGSLSLLLSSQGMQRHAAMLSALEGWSSAQLLDFLEWSGERSGGQNVELVRTQPAEVGEGVDTSVTLRQLFLQAEEEVLVAGFRLTDRELFQPLRREGKALRVRLFVDIDPTVNVYGREQRPADPLLWPAQWRREFLRWIWPEGLPEPELYHAPLGLLPGTSMHMKTVVVDRRQWLVTSANFTSRGQERNFEIGALIRDPEAAGRVLQWFEELVAGGIFVR